MHDPECTAATVVKAMYRHKCAPTRTGEWMTARQAATHLGCTPQWVSAQCRAGMLEAHRNPGGRWWLISAKAIAEYARARAAPRADLARVQGRYFVTPHAVRRFQERVLRPKHLRFPFHQARAILIAALDHDWSAHPVQHTDPLAAQEDSVMVRVNWPVGGQRLCFRAFISTRGISPARPLPKVVTVL
ncbi:MAG: helix-turn-helix domain-containing protein [Rhodospirillales bacterium]|nr:helix-turn-helix domain-containing protein [Rhodospirillales bacterium]